MSARLELHENLTPTQIAILRSASTHMLVRGPAGTGKTSIVLARGLRLLHAKAVKQIVIIRSIVPTRNIGFLPGDGDEKIAPYAAPYIDILTQISPKGRWHDLVAKKQIRFESTSFLRGVTFDDAFVMLDEYQNCSGHELETAITRVGQGTRLHLCGDSSQSDLRGNEAEEHAEIIMTLTRMESVECHEFTVDDIVRSEFVKAYFKAKESSVSLAWPLV